MTPMVHNNAPPTPPENNLFVIWIILVICLFAYIMFAWCDRHRIEREGSSSSAVANAVTTAEQDTKAKQIHFNRVIYAQAFELLSNQCQISSEHFKPIEDIDTESGKFTLNAEGITTKIGRIPEEAVVLAFHKDPKGNDDLCCTGTMCAICWDQYQEGETIVWSQDRDCSHVYHKECLVDYLARRRKPSLEENPCPTCRRNFCQVPVV
jgi:hypothetical protein